MIKRFFYKIGFVKQVVFVTLIKKNTTKDVFN